MNLETDIVPLVEGGNIRAKIPVLLHLPPQQLIVRGRTYDVERGRLSPVGVFQVWLPYLVAYWQYAGGLYLWARPTPMTTISDTLYQFPFPHCSPSGLTAGVCSGALGLDAYATCLASINTYFTTIFRYHLTAESLPPSLRRYGDRRGTYGNVRAYFQAWEKLSRDEVLALEFVESPTQFDGRADAYGRYHPLSAQQRAAANRVLKRAQPPAPKPKPRTRKATR